MTATSPLYRIDKFAVPAAALPEFLPRLQRIDALLAAQPGCRQHLVLVQHEGASDFNVVTVVEWESGAAMAAARARVQAAYREEGFDPAAFMRQLGVRADLAVYAPA